MRHGCRSLTQIEILPCPPIQGSPTIHGLSGLRFASSTTGRKK
jgi:hypothetical protein